jgi:hypothetical protein
MRLRALRAWHNWLAARVTLEEVVLTFVAMGLWLVVVVFPN